MTDSTAIRQAALSLAVTTAAECAAYVPSAEKQVAPNSDREAIRMAGDAVLAVAESYRRFLQDEETPA